MSRIPSCVMAAVALAMAVVATTAIGAQKPGTANEKPAAESLAARARRVQREAIVIDTHIDTTGHIERKDWNALLQAREAA